MDRTKLRKIANEDELDPTEGRVVVSDFPYGGIEPAGEFGDHKAALVDH